MLTELRNRGVADAFIVCCDGLRGLPDAIRVTWSQATVQTFLVHMVRNSLRYASRKHWSVIEFPAELRKIAYATNAIESLNARFRRAVRHRGYFASEQAAMMVLYLVATTRRVNREHMTGRIHGWKQILNALTVHHRLMITADAGAPTATG